MKLCLACDGFLQQSIPSAFFCCVFLAICLRPFALTDQISRARKQKQMAVPGTIPPATMILTPMSITREKPLARSRSPYPSTKELSPVPLFNQLGGPSPPVLK